MDLVKKDYPNNPFHKELHQKLSELGADYDVSYKFAELLARVNHFLAKHDLRAKVAYVRDIPDKIESDLNDIERVPIKKHLCDSIIQILERESNTFGLTGKTIIKKLQKLSRQYTIPSALIGATPNLQQLYLELRAQKIPPIQSEDFVNKLRFFNGEMGCFTAYRYADANGCREEVEKLAKSFLGDLKLLFYEKVKEGNLLILDNPSHWDKEEAYLKINEEIDTLIAGKFDEPEDEKKSYTTLRKQVLIHNYLHLFEKFPNKREEATASAYYIFLQSLFDRNADNIKKSYADYFEWTQKPKLIEEYKKPRKAQARKLFIQDLEEVKALFQSIGYNECVEQIEADIEENFKFFKD